MLTVVIFEKVAKKNVRINVVIKFLTKSFLGEILDIQRMGFAKKLMHDYFFKCKLVAPLCIDMYPAFLHFFTTP